MTTRSPYNGPRRKLVLAFDVGTTFSGISYSILDPGQVPEIKPVTRFPAQETISGASKIPTIIYYNRFGKVCAVGAEATKEGILETAEDEQWIKAEWFKLHLRSKVGAGKNIAEDIPPLPLGKSVTELMADFLQYLLQCASTYIQDTHANGPQLWSSLQKEIHYVLSHPNGWEGVQQTEMRKAAVLAKLITPNAKGQSRLSFVTEGEASLHYSIQNGLPAGAMQNGDGIVIVDAGGGTIDISSYSKKANQTRDVFEEIAAAQCYFKGSVFVNIHAKAYLENYLAESSYAEDIDHIIDTFDKTTKLRFRDSSEPQFIRFGSTRDNDPDYNIRFGQLKLAGEEVMMFFEPSISCIIKAVEEQANTSHHPISHVVLVGGFAQSDWLFKNVKDDLAPLGLNVMRPDNHINKAVSDGAISFYLDNFVNTRVSKVTYGNFCHVPFDSTDPEHRLRRSKTFFSISGSERISDAFDIILAKNTQVSEMTEYKRSYFRESSDPTKDFKNATFSVWCYRGVVKEPMWKDIDTDNYTKLCTIEVNFNLGQLSLKPQKRPSTGATYYRLDYDIVLLFGLTELKALVAWKDNGIEKRSSAKIVYDPDTTDDG